MTTLLIELLTEEMPSALQREAAAQWEKLWREAFAARQLTFDALTVQHTPRRLVLSVSGLPSMQPELVEEKRGPKVGAPQAALDGFLKANGITLAQCEQRTIDKGTFYFYEARKAAQPLADVVREVLHTAIPKVTWAKSMHWADHQFFWGRPLRGILVLQGGAALSGSFSHNGFTLPYASGTVGARQHGSPALALPYAAALEQQGIILDQTQREQAIIEQGNALVAARGLSAEWHKGLLAEVVGLVETPAVLLGTIDAPFMELPPELLISVMRTHQRYFPLLQQDGQLAPFFLVVANNQHPESHVAITAGNERVLRARFSDARFYWDTDRKQPLADFLVFLQKTTFHEKLGSVADKAERMAALASILFPNLEGVVEAARLAKADLASGAVREFPELQGIMGGYYYAAQHGKSGIHTKIAAAIRDHYHPIGAQTDCPKDALSTAVSLVDKIDSLFWLLAAGEKPTGSRDPLGLRRLALAIVRLINERPDRLEPIFFPDAWYKAANTNAELIKTLGVDTVKIADLGTQLLTDRIDSYLTEKYGFSIAYWHAVQPYVRFKKYDSHISKMAFMWANDLYVLLGTQTGDTLKKLYKRATSIVLTAQDTEKTVSFSMPQLSDLEAEQPETRDLYNAHNSKKKFLEENALPYGDVLSKLSELAHPLNNFFDAVLVNCDNPDIRANRLGLLSAVRDLLDTYVDFEKLEG
ncbi:MAG: glycine--tRNA ligase subunit beta [Thalassospira sp.]|nr:glycine--tRNA ligase subunit beta [Thalassospira sp.]